MSAPDDAPHPERRFFLLPKGRPHMSQSLSAGQETGGLARFSGWVPLGRSNPLQPLSAPFPNFATGPVLVHGLGFSPDRTTLVVVSIASNAVNFIDTATNQVKHTTYVGFLTCSPPRAAPFWVPGRRRSPELIPLDHHGMGMGESCLSLDPAENTGSGIASHPWPGHQGAIQMHSPSRSWAVCTMRRTFRIRAS
jgi:hypothetical protein